MSKVLKFFRLLPPVRDFNGWGRVKREICFYVEVTRELDSSEMKTLRWLLRETFEPELFSKQTFLQSGNVVEIGPRLNFETAFSTNAVGACRTCGLDMVTRLEQSRRFQIHPRHKADAFVEKNSDRMTECRYKEPLESFAVDIVPAAVYEVLLLTEGIEALRKINKELGLGMDGWDLEFNAGLFADVFKRNPTSVECFQLAQSNSDHCRHWYFKGKIVIDGVEMPESLLDIVRSTLGAHPENSTIAFCDNSSAINGFAIQTLYPELPGRCSPYRLQNGPRDIIFTAETHNFPSGVAPFPGAETGTGGRIRDIQATGLGGLVVAGTAAYCTGSLHIPGYVIPGEAKGFVYPTNLALPRDIIIQASNGASRYGNEFGEPVVQGFVRTFGLRLPCGERREWLKPIMFTGGVGQMDSLQVKKGEPKSGMKIVQIGGPAYRIGVGGGAASSMTQGENTAELDFKAVQRGNAEMEQKMNRVIRACIEMGAHNPIASIHDQGAGGPCNVVTELINPVGGVVDIRKINVGDQTLSVLELWSAEYQERNALLIKPEYLESFQAICRREKAPCEVLGEVTGNGKIVLVDSKNGTRPVDLELSRILGDMPQKTFTFERLSKKRLPLKLPKNLTVKQALKKVFQLPSVGSKGFLVHKADRSVTGLIAQQQCCGPLQLPMSDVAVTALSHFSQTGAAIAIGEQPIKMLVNAAVGSRMAVGEMLTNMSAAEITALADIKCSGNWMAPAKLPGEGAVMYDAAVAVRDLMIELGIAIDGGKDSLSMAAKVGDEMVKAPTQLVISGYVTMADISKVATPDLKKPGRSELMLINLAPGKYRLGGSALAQAFGQIGNDCPDVDDNVLLKNSFLAIQELHKQGLILSLHDRSDGGLITTVLEMAMAGNCGVNLNLGYFSSKGQNALAILFSEELGVVIEYLPGNRKKIDKILAKFAVKGQRIGKSQLTPKAVFQFGHRIVFKETIQTVRRWWERTSYQLERLQMNPAMAQEEWRSQGRRLPNPKRALTFDPQPTSFQKLEVLHSSVKPKIAILREEGSNGDREMASAFLAAGFVPWDVTMTDLLNGVTSLDLFNMVAFVGGFSYADVLDSAKGWAGSIKFNDQLREQFQRFYSRSNTLSFGVCNGCQNMALLGWIPGGKLPDEVQPRFIHNVSERFESRWVNVKVLKSPAIMFRRMEGSILGVPVAHGEGLLHFPDKKILRHVAKNNLAPLAYVDNFGRRTTSYPFNPNGSPEGITALCSPDGRHLAMMPHPERAFLKWQWHYMSAEWKEKLAVSPWLQLFQNARDYV
jgi:phosphoribosylformylglycinamidine synthase